MSARWNERSFVRKLRIDRTDLVGARWWNEAMLSHRGLLKAGLSPNRRDVIAKVVAGGSVVAFIGLVHLIESASSDDGGDDGVDTVMDALELQRRSGWDVGASRALTTPAGSRLTDVDQREGWREVLARDGLEAMLRPSEARLAPFYDPTLFQAPAHPSANSLAHQLSPMWTAAMDNAFGVGRALSDMFSAAGNPQDTALVIDLPGPEAVAFAAGASDRFAPTFMFGNWPHPRGVVPSHETLASALYYLPVFQRANMNRRPPAPPAIVLDANRLLPYRDAAAEFDNRYAVSMPSASALHDIGVTHLLYVRPDDLSLQELDDLNEDFTALDTAGIPVRAVAASDFWVASPTPTSASTSAAAPAPDGGAVATRVYHYHSGGGIGFWRSYGWYQTTPARSARVVPPAPSASAAPPSRAASYRPVPRQTIFSSRSLGGLSGVGKQKPTGFGRVSVRTSRSGSVSVGSYSRRSGSFGRSSSSGG